MIIGKLENYKGAVVRQPSALLRAFEYLRQTDFTKLEGRQEIEGDRMFAKILRYKAKPYEECKAETHERYADLLYLVKGEELLRWCVLAPGMEVSEPYDAEKDITFYKNMVNESVLRLEAGHFLLLGPSDVHRPYEEIPGDPQDIIKVVMKIDLELLAEA